MKKSNNIPAKIDSISELNRLMDLPKPVHPLIGFFDNTSIKVDISQLPESLLLNFYKISYKVNQQGRMGYGQGYYDFDEGGMVFTAPNQLIIIPNEAVYEGFSLLFHPDFIRNYPLGQKIKQYGFFSYDTNEALHLSEKERQQIFTVVESIKDELNNAIDAFSQDLIVSYIEVLLNYSNRFYKRQFITRKSVNHDLLTGMEDLLNSYFDKEDGLQKGLPTVEFLADNLHVSPRYLSDMLRSLTGQNAQQHIHEKLIEKAKEYLMSTHLSVAEIAYQLGFEHPQSFNKLFKRKTSLTPVEFKQSFHQS
ncbi:AraC-type DNA-binding protein [Chitinophaga ginsengisegetis]|uniref:AraC-type DNA-binding protein n=1 Tax=Chitinophaga ginsengisegetis TaxID=393003 RepID=A0A1T5P8M3_9BACT|nr:helix-turn-helix transcriptional regulator [Chitinophaga ginsengisegetis]SKD09114.1 AraC-type DNA-binding protein [Chitinophaga ginsengisegetis]